MAYPGPCCVGVDNNNPMDQGGDYEWTHYIYEHLLTWTVNPTTVDKNPYSGQYGDVTPELADSWEVSADQLTWTFKLHPGIKWHDGTDFTSADVKFSFELCLNAKTGSPCYPGSSFGSVIKGGPEVKAGTTTDLVGVQAPDPLTITITTLTPQALLPYQVMDLFIINKAKVSAIPVPQIALNPYWNSTDQVGTGPFKVTAYAAGQSMEVSRNDDYWRGKPYLDKIIRREFKDTTTPLLAFDKGEVDVTYVTVDEVERELQSTIGTILPGPSGADLDIVLNPTLQKDWADKRVRQAILSAIDRVSILQNIYHIPDPTPLNCLYLNPDFNPPDVAKFPYDPEKAKALLAEANVDPASWGEVVFDTYYTDQGSLDAMTAIQSNLLDNIGMKVKIQQMESASWSTRFYGTPTQDGVSQMSLIGGDSGPPSNGYGFGTLHSSSAHPGGHNGWYGDHYSNPELDKALEAVSAEFDPAKRVPLLQAVCKIHAEEQPFINLWATTRYWFVNNRIGNFVSTPGPGMGNYYKAAETWFIRP